MAHWAEIDENNNVIRVTVGDNNDPRGDEGYQWLIDNLGGTWIKTSYNTWGNKHLLGGTPLHKNYAGMEGTIWRPDLQGFVPPKPKEHPSFILDEETCLWVPPIPKPDNEQDWWWDEESQQWLL